MHFVGNVMIDTLRANLARAIPAPQIAAGAGRPDFRAGKGEYAVLTLHRPSNVDDKAVLQGLLETAARISERTPVIFPVHPRTRATIEKFGLSHLLDRPEVLLLPPMGYLEMLGLMRDARVVLTDSGGIQEETTALGTPCITLRHNTERPITVDEGTNTIAGNDPAHVWAAYEAQLAGAGKAGRIPHFWDGRAAERIAAIVLDWLKARG